MIEQSKIQKRPADDNPKSLGDSAERAGKSG